MTRLFFALSLLGMIAAQAFAAEALNLQPDGLPCSAFMTCKAHMQSMSVASNNAGPRQSDVPTLTKCIDSFYARPDAETVTLCEKAVSESAGAPRDQARALTTLGHAYAKMPEHYDFIQTPDSTIMFTAWRKAASIDPTFADPLIEMANLYSSAGEGEKALNMLAEAERIDPSNWRVHTRRAIAYRNMHAVEAMLPPAERAMELAPDEFEVRREYALALYHNKRFRESVAQYETAAKLFNPLLHRRMEVIPDENVWSGLADAYKYAGKPAQAAQAITSMFNSRPAGVRSHFDFDRRSQYFEMAGLYQQAADDLAEAAKLAPPGSADQFNIRRTILLTKTSGRQSAVSDLRASLEQGALRPTIKVQLFLRNQGYNDVEINGRYDAATKRALDDCFERSSCIQVIGQAI